MAGVSLGQLSAAARVDVERLRECELIRVRLSEREALRVYRVLFEVIVARLGEMEHADHLNEVLESMATIDVESLLPFALPPF